MTSRFKDKNFVLGVCGGIAAYKSVEVLRLLTKRDASVRVIMTANAMEFVGRMTFEALSGKPVCTNLFERGADASIKHIDWAEAADAVLVAPATANIIGKLANGIADDALTTFMMAVTAPVFICPSMNTNMYASRAVQRNLLTLSEDGYIIIEPGSGELACGTVGPGRLPEPEDIVDRLESSLTPKDLKDKRVLVTAGPTRESVDPVRYISNPSTGKMGYAVARAAENRGAAVTLISGPSLQPKPLNVALIEVNTAQEMAEAVLKLSGDCDVVIKTAAVSDFRPITQADHKLKKDQADMSIPLEKTRDILHELGRRKKPGQILIGFAAETEALEKNAQKKLAQKNLDIIAGNLIGEPGAGFASDTNRVTLYFSGGHREVIPEMDKDAVAHVLIDKIVNIASLNQSDRSN